MKFYMGLGSKVKKLLFSLPAKKGENTDAGLDVKSKLAVSEGFDIRSPGFGSREEAFFDSHAWLDSDCEDDFLSVNGEFTPSRGSTPNYQAIIPVTPSLNKALLINKLLECNLDTLISWSSFWCVTQVVGS